MTTEEKKEYQRKWYQAHKEEVKARSKKYYEDHKEECLASHKRYYEEHKEQILEGCKEYRETHKEEKKRCAERYRDNGGYKRHHQRNKEKRNTYSRKYHEEHKKERNAYSREHHAVYYKTKIGRAKKMIFNYVIEDKKHNRGECTLTAEWYVENILNSKCVYCGDDNYLHLGADRIDNNLPHTPDNCICACGVCNVERQSKRMSVEEFVEYRKTNPRELKRQKLEEIVEINGIKVIRKRAV